MRPFNNSQEVCLDGVTCCFIKEVRIMKRITWYRCVNLILIVHYDTCDLSSTFLHGVKLGPERSEGPNNAVQCSLGHKYRIKFYSTAYLSPLSRLSVP